MKSQQTAAVSLDTLLAYFKGYYDNPTRPLTESQYQEGKALLTRYWETHRGQFPTPYLLEDKFTLHVGPFLLTGRFDRVDITPKGYEIIDYKLWPRRPLPQVIPQYRDTACNYRNEKGERSMQAAGYLRVSSPVHT